MARKTLILAGLVLAGLLATTEKANAWGRGRKFTGGHPYHNGYLFIPPVSAYTAVRVVPPPRYGVPAYYVPESYLAPVGEWRYMPPPVYGTTPLGRAGGYYMSMHAYWNAYPW